VTGRVGSDGTHREAAASSLTRVADPAATFLVTSALVGAVQRGTGRGLEAGRFMGDVAGKTGTSSDWRDAWFVAYAPNIVVGVWVGYDDGRSLGLAGGAAAVPIVSEFFSIADAPLHEPFRVPSGIEEGYTSGGSWFNCGEREYFLAGSAPAGSSCGGFRGLVDGFRREWDGRRERDNDRRERSDSDRLRRIVMDRIRAELEALQHRR
jgi:membrane carboxypeptidase/penicillin-binding protein